MIVWLVHLAKQSGIEGIAEEAMYNLFVSNSPEAWDTGAWTIEAGRCVSRYEYTEEEIASELGDLEQSSFDVLSSYPCIFAYEDAREKNPKFGRIKEVIVRQGKVRVLFEIQHCEPFLSYKDFERLEFELDIRKWEMNRTHWAVKDVQLDTELEKLGIRLPSWASSTSGPIDVGSHQFEVALSFPGEVRHIVEPVAAELERIMGRDTYFYDANYPGQLARPSLDTLLQSIYHQQSKLVVAFIGADYQRKEWCGIEFRAIKDIISKRAHERVMFVRTDPGKVDGVFDTDGYVDATRFSPEQIAEFIRDRVAQITS